MNRQPDTLKPAGPDEAGRLPGAALAAAAAFVLAFAALSVRYARMIDWNGMRIVPVLEWFHGSPLYPARGGGVVNGCIYPPLDALAYAPCAALSDPSHVMELGSLLACLYYFLPLALLARLAVRRWEVRAADATLVACTAALLTFFDAPLRYTAFMAHAEAPGFALGGMALCLLMFSGGGAGWPPVAAGALAAASALSKQTFVGVGAALLLWLLARRRGQAWGFLAGGAAVSAAFCAILLLSGGWQNFVFNCVYIPSHHPWAVHDFVLGGAGGGATVQRIQAVVESFLYMAPTWYPWLALGAWMLWRARGAGPAEPVGAAVLPAWVFAAELPISLMAFKKVGGDVNALGGCLYFLLLALAAFALASASHRAWSASHRAGLAILVIVLMACNAPRLAFLGASAARPDPNAPMMGFLRQHPQQVYLPWNPLLTSLSDGLDYHFEYGVFDRALAGAPLSPEAYRAHLPARLGFVAVRRRQPDSSRGTFRSYLPGLREAPSPRGLEDWQFFEAGPP